MTLFLFLIFMGSAVLGRMFLQYRLTGNHGLRPAHKHSHPLQIIASLLLALSAVLIFLYALGQTLGYLQVSFVPGFIQLCIGYLFYGAGLIFILIAQQQMGSAWRIGVDPDETTELITHGLFQYVRNPIYTGLFVGGLGFLMLSPAMFLLFGLLLGYIAIELFVRKVEEPYLQRQFGTAYQTWLNTTPRYFPKLRLL